MSEPRRPLSEIIAETLYSGGDIRLSDLDRLSDLNNDELPQFHKAWRSAAIERRALLISKLYILSKDDARLDFTGIFKFCLEDPDTAIRITALEGLEIEDKFAVVPPVIRTLKTDESPEVREAAARVMGKFALMSELGELPAAVGDNIYDALLEVLEAQSQPGPVKLRALESIGAYRQEIVASYIEDYYCSEDPLYKASAILAMGRSGDPRWIDFLTEELRSNNELFRFEAARACGEVGDEEAIPGLLNLLDDSDHEAQEAAIAALGKIGGQEAKDALNTLTTSPENRIREAALSALTELEICRDLLSSSS